MNARSKIYIVGHRWLVGSAIVRNLKDQMFTNLVYRTHKELNLTDPYRVRDFFIKEKPEYIFLGAARVGGIMWNSKYPAEFIYDNILIQNNIIHYAYKYWVKKLLFFGSSCIYPKLAKQPIKEDYLLTWKLEPTNEPYAIAKIAWLKMCQSFNRQYGTSFIACMPTNLYGPKDNYDLETSHVLPAMIHKFHKATKHNKDEVVLWWDGTPKREFLHSDDMARGAIHLMQKFKPNKQQNESWDIFFNIWSWNEITIKELANKIKTIIGFQWKIIWDNTKPNGTPRKLIDSTKINDFWWKSEIWLDEWLEMTYKWFRRHSKLR